MKLLEKVLYILRLIKTNSGKMKQVPSWYYHPSNSGFVGINNLPSSNDKAASGFVGINNLATCYMNSLVQQIYQIPTQKRNFRSTKSFHQTTRIHRIR